MQAFGAPESSAVPARAATVVRVDSRSGRLVRTFRLIPSAVAIASPAPVSDLHTLIREIASENGVEESLVHSVIRAESNYNTLALSPKGAQGLMQLIPSTAQRFGVQNSFDARQNVAGGVKYLKFLLDYYHGDYTKTIAAYNAGEDAVDRYNGIPPFAETRTYVVRVAKNLKAARLAHGAIAEPAATPAQPTATQPSIQASMGTDGKVYYRTP